MISGRREPLVEIALGLLKFAVINATALLVLNLALTGADELSRAILATEAQQFSERVHGAFEAANIPSGCGSLSRWPSLDSGSFSGSCCCPAGRHPHPRRVAAVGGLRVLTNATRRWFPTMVAWLIGRHLQATRGTDLCDRMGLVGEGADFVVVLTGIVVLILAVVALPQALKFFSWTGSESAAEARSGRGRGRRHRRGSLGALGGFAAKR
ncbi:hypothetical protein HBB16_09455 [Pseudonocardia sp. MCCB 268]|nr:hypothetical protein [Pseudonocardia cytotoxica]